MTSLPQSETTRFNVISWNLLLDTTRTNNKTIRPQMDRIPGFVRTLQAFDGDLDYVGAQEVAYEKNQNNGTELARALGFDTSFLVQHNQPVADRPGIGRRNEYLGAFGTRVDNAEPVEIGHSRRAIRTMIGGVAVYTTHFRARKQYADARLENAEKLAEDADQYDNAILTLDANERRTQPARTLLEAEAEFHSVFTLLDRPHPKTWPTDSYRKVMYGRAVGNLLPAFEFDDILVRGDIRVIDAGVLDEQPVPMKPVYDDAGRMVNVPNGATDHLGLWATLEADLAAA